MRHRLRPRACFQAVLALCLLLALDGLEGVAQSGAPAKLPIFDVVSVKLNKSGTNNFRSMYSPSGTVEITNTPLLFVIRQAYSLYNSNDDQITGLPEWAKTERYDIQAKVSEADAPVMKTLTREQRGEMLQGLLADRFKMVAHTETRERPVYALVVAKGGTKLHEADATNTYPDGIHAPDGKGGGAGMMRMGRDFIDAQAIPMSQLLGTLTQLSGRTVLDKTGLTGKYDVHLKWAPDDPGLVNGAPAPESAYPPLFTAIQEQLGLKLESQKGPVPGVVVDHIERPAEN